MELISVFFFFCVCVCVCVFLLDSVCARACVYYHANIINATEYFYFIQMFDLVAL